MLFRFRLFAKVYYAIGIIVAIIFIGTFGFMWIEGWTFVEAFYMTIITITTVGFGEVHPLDTGGRMFAIGLILTSFGTFAYAISAITTYLVGGEYRVYFREYKSRKEVDKLENHTIICGYGRVGKQAALELEAHNKPYVVVEKDDDAVLDLKTHGNLRVINGDATDDESLIKAGIERAAALITAMPSDADNLFIVVSARAHNPNLTIVSRAITSTTIKKLRMAGANNVIMPDQLGGSHMASLIITPDVIEFLDHISIRGRAETNLEEINFSELPHDERLQTIGDIDRFYNVGCRIIGYKTALGDFVVNPGAKTELIPKSKLFVLGTPVQIELLNSVLGIKS